MFSISFLFSVLWFSIYNFLIFYLRFYISSCLIFDSLACHKPLQFCNFCRRISHKLKWKYILSGKISSPPKRHISQCRSKVSKQNLFFCPSWMNVLFLSDGNGNLNFKFLGFSICFAEGEGLTTKYILKCQIIKKLSMHIHSKS